MKIAILIYVAVSLLFGAIAATFEVWTRPVELPRATGGTHPSPPFSALGVGLFVTLFWPVILIGVIL